MPNEEHLKLLKQGVDAWNRWRHEHADTRPDLSTANLSTANLIRADLSAANLGGGAYLSEADLTAVRLGRNKSRKRESNWVPNLWNFSLECKSK